MIARVFRNVHQALPEMLDQSMRFGLLMKSRNGDVLKFDSPVSTLYTKPRERVLFWEKRDANPYFHLMESLWMLGGRMDVAFLAQFVKRMEEYSDDGETFHGAYGHRWRTLFGMDQLDSISGALKSNPSCRRQVLQMWDAGYDIDQPDKRDLPCNTHAYFQRNVEGALDMMVSNRSNDMLWGAYGANAVHFSMLQEYIAARIGCEVGRYWQVSFNMHAYTKILEQTKIQGLRLLVGGPTKMDRLDPYAAGAVQPFPLVNGSIDQWDEDLKIFLGSNGTAVGMRDRFFRRVAVPMMESHIHHRNGDKNDALKRADDIVATDWRMACIEWLQRRAKR